MTEAFLGITAHFFTGMDDKGRVDTLAVRKIQSPHTADRIEVVWQVLEEWEILREDSCNTQRTMAAISQQHFATGFM